MSPLSVVLNMNLICLKIAGPSNVPNGLWWKIRKDKNYPWCNYHICNPDSILRTSDSLLRNCNDFLSDFLIGQKSSWLHSIRFKILFFLQCLVFVCLLRFYTCLLGYYSHPVIICLSSWWTYSCFGACKKYCQPWHCFFILISSAIETFQLLLGRQKTCRICIG